jgi:hydroxymethylpyrimidine/phosphomethylpyrimidine kinase
VIPTALTIAGSDSSGGAGLQADLKTFSALKVYGMTVITAVTAQNTTGVCNSVDIPVDIVAEQFDAVVQDIRPGAVKTGMLSNSAIVEMVASKIRQYALSTLIVDPVMISTSGSNLLNPAAVEALRRHLLPLALVVTPNIHEASLLTKREIRTAVDMEEAALDIYGLGPKHVYIKGGHLDGPAIDVFFDGSDFTRFESERVLTEDTHGTGCVLSAAMTAFLARGEPLASTLRLSKDFITSAIRRGLRLGKGRGPCDPIGINGLE